MKICCEQLFYESLGFHRFSCQKFFIGLKKIGTGNFKLVKLCREQLISQIFTEKKDAFCFTEIYYCPQKSEFWNLELVKLYREQLFNESLGFHRFFTTKKDAFCFTENAWLGAVLVTKQKGCACVNFGLYHNGQDIQILSGNYKECFHLK